MHPKDLPGPDLVDQLESAARHSRRLPVGRKPVHAPRTMKGGTAALRFASELSESLRGIARSEPGASGFDLRAPCDAHSLATCTAPPATLVEGTEIQPFDTRPDDHPHRQVREACLPIVPLDEGGDPKRCSSVERWRTGSPTARASCARAGTPRSRSRARSRCGRTCAAELDARRACPSGPRERIWAGACFRFRRPRRRGARPRSKT